MDTILLNGVWKVRAESFSCTGETGLVEVLQKQDNWMPAQVPGEIHLDLLRLGQMPDPSVSMNMPDCRWPETKSWWYRTTLELDEEFVRHERQELVFDGLDLYAQVFLNDKLVGEAKNALVPAVFDVKRFLRIGENDLVVRLTAGSELAKDETPAGQGKEWKPNSAAQGAIPNPIGDEDLYRHRGWPGRKWLRKPQFSYGWDWVDALPNIGIWRGVHLEGRTHSILHDLRLDTLLNDDRTYLEMEAIVENLHPWSERVCELVLEIQPPDGGEYLLHRYPIDAFPGRNTIRDTFEIPQAKLWWPNGCGEQPLYKINASVLDPTGKICDYREFSIGLRTIALDRSRLIEGSRFCFRVNGEVVFCRGVNIGPHDAILARISDAKYEALVAEAKNAHLNMIRINGCSIFEPAVFYEACDRAGIMVWHDLLLTDITYPDDDNAFCEAVRDEVTSAIRLLRHHPSIVLWCGNNENTWIFPQINPDLTRPMDLGGQKLYYQILPDVCRHLDPRRIYWPSSPCGGEYPNSELQGNCHWWNPFFMNPDINRRIRHEVWDECRARFVTEYGVIGPCHLDSIREYLLPEEMRPGSKAWQLHTNSYEKETVPAGIRLHYADPDKLTIPEYVLYGQMFQAILHGHAMEALRFRKNDPVDDCQGALIWSYSDCWGETGWSILDYYLRRKASYYWFRQACVPVKVIVRRRGENLVTRLVNDTLRVFQGRVEYGWWRLDGKDREIQAKPVLIEANQMLELYTEPITSGRDPRQWLYAAVLYPVLGPAIDHSIWLMRPHRELALAYPEIQVTQLEDGRMEVSSPVYCHAVHTEDHGRELIGDNWFDLLPGVAKCLHLSEQARFEDITFTAVTGVPV
jgi:beta-mannosidase